MPLVWRNRGLLLLNHAIGLQKQHKSGSASPIVELLRVHADHRMINHRGCHPVMQRPDRFTLLRDRGPPDRHSFAQRRPRRSPHSPLRCYCGSCRYGRPAADPLGSTVGSPREFHYLERGPDHSSGLSEKVQEISERGDKDHERLVRLGFPVHRCRHGGTIPFAGNVCSSCH